MAYEEMNHELVQQIREKTMLQNRVEESLKELAYKNRELKEFAYIVSHDLKSPLRSISALTSWIKMDNHKHFDKASLQNFDDIELTLEKMDSLISDVLKFSSIESDSLSIKTPFNILKIST